MKVLFLSEVFYPHGSGGDLATYLYARLLAGSGFNVRVVTNRFPGESDKSLSGNLTVYHLPLLRSTQNIKYSLLERVDVLFSNFMRKLMHWADVVYIPKHWYSAIPLAKSYGKPVITHFHGYFPVCPLAALFDLSKNTICNTNNFYICSARCIIAYERGHGKGSIDTLKSAMLNSTIGHCFYALATLSDAMIFVSKAQRKLMTARKPFMGKKSHVVYNPLPKSTNLDIVGNDFGYFGGPSPLKGFNVLCSALTIMKKRKMLVHATQLHSLAKSVTTLLAKLGIISYGKLDEEKLESIYKSVRAVIVPSIWPEPWGFVVTEAILRGRLIIASPVGGIREQIKGCKGAFLFPAGNYEQLVEMIESVKSLNKETVTDLGAQNRQSFLKRFNNEKTLHDFTRVLIETADQC